MNSEQNGQYTQDPPGNEGRQEAEGQPYRLQQQACADAGGSPRKRGRIVYIENSSNTRSPFVVQEVGTVDELIQGVCLRFPEICITSIGMEVSSSPYGTIGRKVLTDEIAYEHETLYIRLYLKKHTF
jgi:hypothetical protein